MQKAVNRIQPYAEVAQLVNCIHSHGFRSLSFDLIYGLPHQDRHTMVETLRKVINLRPDRIAFYSYAHVPWKAKGQRKYDENDLPDDAAGAVVDQGVAVVEPVGLPLVTRPVVYSLTVYPF